jgi:DNA-binding transcriptional LysR family regulator
MRTPSWDDLQAFVAVSDAGSVGAAAQRLKVNHSTVLRRLASLEAALGTRLFDRLPGGYAPTASGNALAGELTGVAERIDAARRRLAGLDEEIAGTIRVTTTDTLLPSLLMPLFAAFGARHPAVQLQIAVANNFLSLTQREADVAVRGSNRPPDNLVGRRIGDIRTALYASRAYLATLGGAHELDACRFVAPDESLSHLEQAKWLHRHVPSSRIAMRVDSLTGMVDAVAAGVGAGMLLCPLADGRPDLVRLRPPDPRHDTQIWILTHPGLRQVARIRAFAQFLFERLSTDPRFAH